jgi:hypothetical protein
MWLQFCHQRQSFRILFRFQEQVLPLLSKNNKKNEKSKKQWVMLNMENHEEKNEMEKQIPRCRFPHMYEALKKLNIHKIIFFSFFFYKKVSQTTTWRNQLYLIGFSV